MTDNSPKPSRGQVLDAFAVEPVHDRTTLERYLRDFPQFSDELVELSREVSRIIDEDEIPLAAHEEALIEAAWQSYASIEKRSAKDPLAALSVPQLREVAHALDVPRQVIMAFRERRVKLESVPKPFLEALARVLSCSVNLLLSGLSAPSGHALARSYKADVKPSAGAEISFEQLLIDAGVPETKRTKLLDEDD
jgi:hypothetical protein